MNKLNDKGWEIEFDAKLPMEALTIYSSIADNMDKITMLSKRHMDDEERCSLAYGKTIWQMFLFPLLKDIADEIDVDPSDLVQDIYNWFDHCHM